MVLAELGAWARDTNKMDKVLIREMREMDSRGIITGGVGEGQTLERKAHGIWETSPQLRGQSKLHKASEGEHPESTKVSGSERA